MSFLEDHRNHQFLLAPSIFMTNIQEYMSRGIIGNILG